MLPQNHFTLRQRPPKQTLLGEISLNTNTSNTTHPDLRKVSPDYWLKRYRKDFPKFRIFLDNLDNKHRQSLERKIVLLGATNEAFFCKKCTHLITTKPFYEELSPTTIVGKATNSHDLENIQQLTDNSDGTKPAFPKKPNRAKDSSQQLFFDRAHSLGIEVWSLSKILCVVNALMNKTASHGPALDLDPRHESLNKMLLEEKRYGVSTGHRNGHARRPAYVTFNDYYAKVEDVTGVHCPILVKEFPTPTFDPDQPENERTYPWPKLYLVSEIQARSGQTRSPFCAPDRLRNPENPASIPHEPSNPEPENTCIPLHHNPPDQENHNIGTPGSASVDRSLLNSKTPFTTTSTNPSYQRVKSNTIAQTPTSCQTTPGMPRYENMSRMDRRTVHNQRVPCDLRPAVAAKAAHDQAERRKKDLARRTARENSKYCENCAGYYQDLDKHVQEESHLAFVRDQNNFKELDKVLQTTRRLHNKP